MTASPSGAPGSSAGQTQSSLPVGRTLNTIFNHTFRGTDQPIRGQLVSAAIAKMSKLRISRTCVWEPETKPGSAPTRSHLSLTNGSSFWRAVNCNRHQAPRTENRGAGAASSIQCVTENCPNCLSGYKRRICAPFIHNVGPMSASKVNNKA